MDRQVNRTCETKLQSKLTRVILQFIIEYKNSISMYD